MTFVSAWTATPYVSPMRLLRILAVLVAFGGLLLLASSGLGTQAGLWDFRAGLTMLRYAAYVGTAGLVLTVLALIASRPRGGTLALLLVAMVAAAVTIAVPRTFSSRARSVPPIHDITTDTDDPPSFVAIVPLRANAPNGVDYAGDSIAALQRDAYPDIVPLRVNAPPQAAFESARDAARAMGWEIVATDAEQGRIEATATTTWFGFKDDVVIRVRGDSSTSRVDVRSMSRLGRSDVGANAARIRAYASRLSATR